MTTFMMPAMLVLLTSQAFAAAMTAGPGGPCKGPLDCNAQECVDCSCDNNNCVCADGWSGDHCQTPFCANRTQCSNHGSCHQTLHNITCNCDAGFTGPHCGTATCSLTCRHGGAPNANCTKCQGCLGAWTGPTCETYDDSVPTVGLLAAMQTRFEDVQQQLNSSDKLLCTDMQACVGWGVDLFDGRVTNIMATLTPDTTDPSKHWRTFIAPQEVQFTPFQNPQANFDLGAGVFGVPSDVASYVKNIVGQNQGLQGLYSSSWTDIMTSYFDSPADEALSVVQGQIGLFKMALPQASQANLDRHFVDIIQSVPAGYNTSNQQIQWDRFFELYGTSMVVQSTNGGLVEQRSRWKTPLSHSMVRTQMLINAQIDFSTSTGLNIHSGTIDPTYAANRVLDTSSATGEDYWCYGGDPSKCAKGDTAQWQASLGDSPVLLSYTTVPLSQLLAACPHTASDPTLRVAMETAVSGYLAKRKAQWAAVNKCPKSGCNGHGTCTAPAEQCTCGPRLPPPAGSACTMTPFIGRMCSGGTGGTGAITGGTRTVQFRATNGYKSSGSVACVNGKWTDPKSSFTHCNTDARGRLQVVLDGLYSCTGPWSSGTGQGATGSCTDSAGYTDTYTFL